MCKTSRIPIHQNDDRTPEFALMSKGLGSNYLTDNKIKWHKKNLAERMYLNLKDGKKIAMPRYYKNKIYSAEEQNAVNFHMSNLAHAETAQQISDTMSKLKCSKEQAISAIAEKENSQNLQKIKNHEKRNQTTRTKI